MLKILRYTNTNKENRRDKKVTMDKRNTATDLTTGCDSFGIC